jgi:predicted acyl esterase
MRVSSDERCTPHGTTLWNGAIEAGDTERIVDAGYVHVISDVRGTGDSGGEYRGFLTPTVAMATTWLSGSPISRGVTARSAWRADRGSAPTSC